MAHGGKELVFEFAGDSATSFASVRAFSTRRLLRISCVTTMLYTGSMTKIITINQNEDGAEYFEVIFTEPYA